MDQENIIDNILNENEDVDLDINKENYDLNAIINEQFLDKEETKENQNDLNEDILNEILEENNNETQNEINKNSQNEDSKEPIKEIPKKEKEIFEETPKILSEEDKKIELEDKNEKMKKEKEAQLEKDIKEIEIEENKQKEKEEEKEKKEIIKKKEEESKIEDFYPPNKNPLDFIQFFEVERVSMKISNEMNNFILQNNIKKDNKYEVSEIISLSKMGNEISKLDINIIYAKSNNLILGTIDGSLLFYSLKSQSLLRKLSPKNLNNSYINCFDIADDYSYLVCGYQDGTIAVIYLISEEVKYTNKTIYKNCPCMELKIYKKEKTELHFISSGGDGKIYYHVLKMSFFWRLNSEQINNENNSPIFIIKFINFALEKQSYKNLIALKKYVILGSLEQISVYCVEPLKEIFTIKKPDFIEECVVPDAQIGIGRSPDVFVRFSQKDEKNHLLLIISWGKIIFFYRLPIVNKGFIENYTNLGFYINSCNILRIGFMNNSVIYCLDKSFSIKFLDCLKVNPGKVNIKDGQLVEPKNNSLAEIETKHFASTNFSSQTKLKDSKQHPKNTYLYSIVENSDSSSIVVLGEKQLYNVKLINWEKFLNNLQKNQDFLNLFSVGIELFKGKMMSLDNIPGKKVKKEIIGNFLKKIVEHYVILNTGEKKASGYFLEETEDNQKIINCIKMVIEFCIEIEAVDYLFKTIQKLFESKEYGNLFLEKLEPFILCDKFINIDLPIDLILNLIDLYNEKGKLDILNQILLHINIKLIDSNEIIKKRIEELFLITPLIYLYMNGQEENYFAPLEKMFDYFNLRNILSLKTLINKENNTTDYSYALTKKLITPKEVICCKEYNGHKILWYIKWCLTGKKFPDASKKMKTDLFNALVPKMTYWLLNPKVINEFLEFDPKNYFVIHKNIFMIEDLRKKLLISSQNSEYTIEVKTSLLTDDIKIEDIRPISLINYMIDWCKKKNEIKIYFYLYDFIITLFHIETEIGIDLKLESICFILNNYTSIVKYINNEEVTLMKKNLIKLFENEDKFSEEDYKKILSSINNKIFSELKLFLYDKIDYFEECLKLYLNKDFELSNKREKLFNWLNDKLKLYKKGHYKYAKFKEIIKENALPLASALKNLFFDLTKEIFQGSNKEIIMELKGDKNIQLNYIELLVKYINSTYENNENNVTIEEMDEIKYILETHIYLLCDLKKHDKIIPALKSCSFYPLKTCLKICEKSNAYQPCLFLYLKEGSIEEAFKLANSRLDKTFNKLIKNINEENNDSEHKNLFNDFHKYFNDIKNICENNEQNLEDIWFKILQQLYKYEKESRDLYKKNEFSLNKKHNSKDLYENILYDIKELLEKMCSYVSIKRILQIVSERNKNAGFKEFRDLLMKILSSYSNLTNILDSARNLLINLVFENEEIFQNFNLTGQLISSKICLKCRKKFNKNLECKDKILIFNCKHAFHKNCIAEFQNKSGKEIFCPICSILEFINNEDNGKNSLIKKNTSVITEKKGEDSEFQINVSSSVIKTLHKLERYDKNDIAKQKLMINNSINILQDQYRYEQK